MPQVITLSISHVGPPPLKGGDPLSSSSQPHTGPLPLTGDGPSCQRSPPMLGAAGLSSSITRAQEALQFSGREAGAQAHRMRVPHWPAAPLAGYPAGRLPRWPAAFPRTHDIHGGVPHQLKCSAACASGLFPHSSSARWMSWTGGRGPTQGSTCYGDAHGGVLSLLYHVGNGQTFSNIIICNEPILAPVAPGH